jgi:hypothetical protein
VAEELGALGFRWFPVEDAAPLEAFLGDPDPGLLEDNRALAVRHFSLDRVAERLRGVLAGLLGKI